MDLVQLALQCGATKAEYLRGDQIVLSDEFRRICEGNGCGNYNRCYMCPPDIGPIEELMAKVRQYDHAVLYQTVSPLEDSFDFEGMMEAGHRHALLSQRIQNGMTKTDVLHLSSGGCHLCEVCAKRDNLPCRQPDKALASLEGYGIDVYNTSQATGLKYINGPDTVTYFGILLYTEASHG